MHELAEQLISHGKAIWRFRWYAVVAAWLIAIGGWIAVYQMPVRYEAEARLYVDTQSVLRPLLAGLTVQPNLDQLVVMMGRTLVSRPNLEKVLQMSGLDDGLMTDESRTKLVDHLSEQISVRSAGKENLYTISAVDEDPGVAKRVVQSLLTLFVQGSSIDKRNDSDSARQFIDEQLEGYREKLQAAEQAISEFKRRNQGLLPGGASGYFDRVVESRAVLGQARLELREAENSRDSIRNRVAGVSEFTTAASGKVDGEGETQETEIDTRLRALGQKLDNLRTTYTEQHPDIVAIVRIIEQLKVQKEEEARQKQAEAQSKGPSPNVIKTSNPIYQQLTVSLTAAEAQVAAMKARVAEYGQRHAELQALANAMPQAEAEFTQLTRDYEVYRVRYDELLKRRDSAQISGDMEASNLATAFRVVDPPHVGPISRDPRLMMTIVLVAALGGGVGIAFLISQIKPTINDERRLREVTGLRVLGTVAMTMTDSQKGRRRRGLAAFLISFASLLSAYGAIMAALVLTASRA